MGVSGHILGPKKLRRLSALTGLPLSRAMIRGHNSVGIVWTEDGCEHYEIDPKTGAYERITDPVHWTTCNPASRSEVTGHAS